MQRAPSSFDPRRPSGPRPPSGLRRAPVANAFRIPRESLLMFLVALALRVAYVWLAAGPGAQASSDAVTYDTIARHLASDIGFRLSGAGGTTYPTAFVPPVLPFLVGVLYRAIGHPDFFAALLMQAVFGALVAPVLAALGAAVFGSPVGRVAGWLAAVHPLLVFFSGYLLTETTFTLALLLAIYTSMQWLKTPRPGRAIGAGLMWGLAALTRPTALPLPLVVMAWAWAPLGLTVTSRERLKQLALLVLGVALIVGPWTVRNAFQMHALVPVTTGGGRSLLDANNPVVWNDPAQRGGANSVYSLEPWASRFRGLSEVEVDRLSAQLAREFLVQHATEWPAMAAAKVARFWRLGAEAGTTGHWQRSGSPLAAVLRVVDPLLAWSLLTLPLGVWGAVVVLRGARRLFQSLPLLIIATFTLYAVLYWGSLRMRVPVEPLVLLYTATGANELWKRLRVRRSGLRVIEGTGRAN